MSRLRTLVLVVGLTACSGLLACHCSPTSPQFVDDPERIGIPSIPRAIRQAPSRMGRAYGQGQKTINVFLKFYVDWASRPTADAAIRLRPWLHCPLDKVIMDALRAHDKDEWHWRIWVPHYRGRVAHQQRASMSSVNEPAYHAWQSWIRELSPEKPILVDTIWSLSRSIKKGEA